MKILLLAALAAASGAAPDGVLTAKQDFILGNRTGLVLSRAYVAPAGSGDWSRDLLGEDTLADGLTQDIKFHRVEKTCRWDLKVVYERDRSEATWTGLDLCKAVKITLRRDKKTGKVNTEVE